jgi:hypothetical protein
MIFIPMMMGFSDKITAPPVRGAGARAKPLYLEADVSLSQQEAQAKSSPPITQGYAFRAPEPKSIASRNGRYWKLQSPLGAMK